MEIFKQPKQKFDLSILIGIILTITVSMYLAYLVSLSTWDSMIIGTAIRILLIGAFFFILLKIIKIYDNICVGILGIISGLIVSFFPFIFSYYASSDEISINGFFNHISYLIEITGYKTIPGSSDYSSGGLFSFLFYNGIQMFFIIICTFGIVFYFQKPYSKKYDKFYNCLFNINYIMYQEGGEYLNRLGKFNLNFEIIQYFLQDSNRFLKTENVKRENIVGWSIPQENEIIIHIKSEYYILNKDESMYIKERLK